jgi:hypothetical protein
LRVFLDYYYGIYDIDDLVEHSPLKSLKANLERLMKLEKVDKWKYDLSAVYTEENFVFHCVVSWIEAGDLKQNGYVMAEAA